MPEVDSKTALLLKNKDERIEFLHQQLHEIEMWCRAYPVEVFPEPDWSEVNAKLGPKLLTRVSASNMRHVCDGIRKIIDRE